MAVATVANWTFTFLVSYFFLSLVGRIGRGGTFWLYAGLGVLAVLFFWRRVPETKNRSLEEIERDLGAAPTGPARSQPARADTCGLRSAIVLPCER
jgi:Sugar (and other) transporter